MTESNILFLGETVAANTILSRRSVVIGGAGRWPILTKFHCGPR